MPLMITTSNHCGSLAAFLDQKTPFYKVNQNDLDFNRNYLIQTSNFSRIKPVIIK
jgi:hypothetical protein